MSAASRRRQCGGRMTRTAVPDPLLAPLLDVAADVLRGLAPADGPGRAADPRRVRPARASRCDRPPAAAPGPRPRRRLPGRHGRGVRRPAGGGGGARGLVSPTRASDVAVDAADARRPPAACASALYAAQPAGSEFGLGVACAEDRHRRSDRNLHDEVARTRARASPRPTRRAAGPRRARGGAGRASPGSTASCARSGAADATRGARPTAGPTKPTGAVARGRGRARQGPTRPRAGRGPGPSAKPSGPGTPERRLRERAARRRDRSAPPVPTGPTSPTAARAAARPRRAGSRRWPTPSPTLAAGPRSRPAAGARHRRGDAGAGESERAARPVPCPPGLRVDAARGASTRCCATGAWCSWSTATTSRCRAGPGLRSTEQRDRLVSALERLHLRLRCRRDGGLRRRRRRGRARPGARPGVRVVFSPAGRAGRPGHRARRSRRCPLQVPVLVASSDGWVRDARRRARAPRRSTSGVLARRAPPVASTRGSCHTRVRRSGHADRLRRLPDAAHRRVRRLRGDLHRRAGARRGRGDRRGGGAGRAPAGPRRARARAAPRVTPAA